MGQKEGSSAAGQIVWTLSESALTPIPRQLCLRRWKNSGSNFHTTAKACHWTDYNPRLDLTSIAEICYETSFKQLGVQQHSIEEVYKYHMSTQCLKARKTKKNPYQVE